MYIYIYTHTHTHTYTRTCGDLHTQTTETLILSSLQIIDTEPPIDAESTEGTRPTEVRGEIELRNVSFR